MIADNKYSKGKYIEYYLISELLKNGFDIYAPIIDTGLDLIVKDRDGGFVEIQIKSRTIKSDTNDFQIKDFKPKQNFFIVCHDITNNEFFIVPSITFHRNSTEFKVDGKLRRRIYYSTLKKYEYYKNEKGLELLKKALENPYNRILGAL